MAAQIRVSVLYALPNPHAYSIDSTSQARLPSNQPIGLPVVLCASQKSGTRENGSAA